MGQQVSKDIRSRLEHCTLEELLIDDKYVEELERHLPGLPKRSHNNLAKILASWENTLSKDSNSGSQPNPPPKGGNSSPKDRNSRTCKLGSLWSIQPKDISIPQSVAEVLKQNHCNLLRQSSKNGVDLQSPADYYEYTCNVETGRTLDKILWRFLTTFYYDLISELDATKQRLSTTENGGVAFVVAVVCRSGKHDPDTVREKVIGWAKVGRRYRGFMDALCSGCLILFPERTSDLVWEQYVPIKGDTFAKVIQFLRDLGIVYKCEKEGWNDLSDKILQALREPFRSFISFQFQPGQQSQIGWAAISSLAQVPGDADIHRPGLSILSCDPVEEIQDMGIDNPSSSKTLDSRALPRLAANRVIKTKRKKGSTSVRRQLQSFAKYLTAHQTPRPEKSLPLVVRQSHHASRAHRSEIQHETHGRDPQGQFPRAPTQCWASAPNDPGQRHLATNHQDDSLPSFQLPTNDQLRKPVSDISLNATNIHDVDQQRTGESISDTLRLERIGISTISAVLNNNTSTTALATAQDSLQGSEDGCTETVSGVAGQKCLDKATACQTKLYLGCDKDTLCRIVRERPTDISGNIWFGCPPGYRPFVSLRLPKSLGKTVKLSSQEVHQPEPSPDAGSTFTALYLIKLGDLCQLIQRDGFGTIFWNDSREGDDAIVSVEVVDEGLMAEFIQVGIVLNGLQQ